MGLVVPGLLGTGAVASEPPLRLRVIGGLAGVTQFRDLEEPFWTREVPALTQGRVEAEIHPFDASGFRGHEMLRLMRLGVVPFGTALLAATASEEPELNAIDLPLLNPDQRSLKAAVDAYRDRLRTILRERYDVELLGVYVYPAQVLFCARPFKDFAGLAGLRVRTSSVSQAELMAGLGAIPVVIPFAEVTKAVRDKVVDCVVTGTQSAIEIGLANLVTHVHPTPITWGVSVFGSNAAAWAALPEPVRTALRAGVADLEARIWRRSGEDTIRGLTCGTGSSACPPAARKRLTLVSDCPSEAERRRLLGTLVLPRWLDRCGPDCAAPWDASLAPVVGLRAGPP